MTDNAGNEPVMVMTADSAPERRKVKRTDLLLLLLIGLLVQGGWAALVSQPTYMDAYYYASNGRRLAGGHGFTEQIIVGGDRYSISPVPVFAIDFDGDADLDVLGGGREVVWWENNGRQEFVRRIFADEDPDFGHDSTLLRASDFDQDGDVDALGATLPDVIWWENEGDGLFTKHVVGNYGGTGACGRPWESGASALCRAAKIRIACRISL